jgi:hypothetical protein
LARSPQAGAPAIGHELHDGRIYRVDPDLEAPQQALALPASREAGTGMLEVAED